MPQIARSLAVCDVSQKFGSGHPARIESVKSAIPFPRRATSGHLDGCQSWSICGPAVAYEAPRTDDPAARFESTVRGTMFHPDVGSRELSVVPPGTPSLWFTPLYERPTPNEHADEDTLSRHDPAARGLLRSCADGRLLGLHRATVRYFPLPDSRRARPDAHRLRWIPGWRRSRQPARGRGSAAGSPNLAATDRQAARYAMIHLNHSGYIIASS